MTPAEYLSLRTGPNNLETVSQFAELGLEFSLLNARNVKL